MILFDYGQTIIDEIYFDGIKGTEAVLQYATKNKYNKTALEIQEYVNELNDEIGRFDPARLHQMQVEIHNYPFQRYLYEMMGVELSISGYELETVFWDNAAPAKPTKNIENLLDYLYEHNIRTGVISNISFSGDALKERINHILPNHHFEFVIASSDYVFRKPNKRIFDLALMKSELEAKDIWFCGDQVKCDVDGAYASGMIPVWYVGAMGMKQSPPDKDHIKVEDWLELLECIKGDSQ
jgi:putative hydrolase of the HAD superfamily